MKATVKTIDHIFDRGIWRVRLEAEKDGSKKEFEIISSDEYIEDSLRTSKTLQEEDVGKFLRALNDGSVFDDGEQEIYPYEYNHGGLVIGYQSLAEYHKDIDGVVVQFINTTDFNGYEWNLSEITINRIAKIIRKKN